MALDARKQSTTLECKFGTLNEKDEVWQQRQSHAVYECVPPPLEAITWYARAPGLQNKYESDGDVNGDGRRERRGKSQREREEKECDTAERRRPKKVCNLSRGAGNGITDMRFLNNVGFIAKIWATLVFLETVFLIQRSAKRHVQGTAKRCANFVKQQPGKARQKS